jgi:hypothetical protein
MKEENKINIELNKFSNICVINIELKGGKGK